MEATKQTGGALDRARALAQARCKPVHGTCRWASVPTDEDLAQGGALLIIAGSGAYWVEAITEHGNQAAREEYEQAVGQEEPAPVDDPGPVPTFNDTDIPC